MRVRHSSSLSSSRFISGASLERGRFHCINDYVPHLSIPIPLFPIPQSSKHLLQLHARPRLHQTPWSGHGHQTPNWWKCCSICTSDVCNNNNNIGTDHMIITWSVKWPTLARPLGWEGWACHLRQPQLHGLKLGRNQSESEEDKVDEKCASIIIVRTVSY